MADCPYFLVVLCSALEGENMNHDELLPVKLPATLSATLPVVKFD